MNEWEFDGWLGACMGRVGGRAGGQAGWWEGRVSGAMWVGRQASGRVGV
jgi:hypothetical protein